MHDEKLDIDRRNAALDEARSLIRESCAAPEGRLGDAEVERILADYRYKILGVEREEEEAVGAGADEFASETGAAEAEDAAISSVAVALPEERRRIKELLAKFPAQRETKVEKLLGALGVLWREDPKEHMVIFATYLGSVEMLGAEIGDGVPWPRRHRAERRRPRGQSRRRTPVQSSGRATSADLYSGWERRDQPPTRPDSVQLRFAVEPNGPGTADRAHPPLRPAQYRADLQSRVVGHN